MRRLAWLVASGLGTGRAPVAPGTVGSFAALIVGAGLLWGSSWVLAGGALLATVGGFWAVRRIVDPEEDPGWVVIDEVAGQWIAMLALSSVSLPGLAAAFLLFRLLDVTKPGPVGWADRQSGATGVMLDDLIAGAGVAVVLTTLRLVWPGLLG